MFVPINSYGHVGTLRTFNGTPTQHKGNGGNHDIRSVFDYNRPIKQQGLTVSIDRKQFFLDRRLRPSKQSGAVNLFLTTKCLKIDKSNSPTL